MINLKKYTFFYSCYFLLDSNITLNTLLKFYLQHSVLKYYPKHSAEILPQKLRSQILPLTLRSHILPSTLFWNFTSNTPSSNTIPRLKYYPIIPFSNFTSNSPFSIISLNTSEVPVLHSTLFWNFTPNTPSSYTTFSTSEILSQNSLLKCYPQHFWNITPTLRSQILPPTLRSQIFL